MVVRLFNKGGSYQRRFQNEQCNASTGIVVFRENRHPHILHEKELGSK